ncbi:FAD-dependent oxidoreductase [Streptomyces sp. NPDC049915]|uniref:flavin monoamine oxidase family protein n=1 Tax=Streptomyces sp. NPDC049915 TaxID=3155510 RepID=UPI0034477E5A
MSRTQLMHALSALTADHAAAHRLGVPVAEARQVRRRTVLKGALATAAVTAAAAPARAAAASAPRIAVVGAGIAGLTAALTLHDAGYACTLYEANPDRVGGRMYSQRDHWAWGQTSEIGGELIDTGHKKIQELCRRFSLPLEDFLGGGPNGAEEVFFFDGVYYPRARADEDFKAVYQALHTDLQAAGEVKWNQTTAAGTALDTMSLYDWIESHVPGGHASPLGQLFDVAYNVEYGADTTEQSSLALVLLMGYQTNPGDFNIWGLSDERYHIVGGNDQLPHSIAGSLPAGTIRQGWSLQAVRAEADGTQTLTFSEAGTTRTVTADHTVLCVPLPILQRLDLSRAGFDPRMTSLLRDARMGYCTKLNMQFSSRLWRGTGPWPGVSAGECFTDGRVQQTWTPPRSSPAPAASSSSTAAAASPSR